MNLYIGALIVGVIFAITPAIKKNILNDLTKDEFSIYGSLIFIAILFLVSRFKGGLQFKTISSHKLITCGLLILSSGLVFVYSDILNDLINEYSADSVMLNIKAVETVILFLIACLFSSAFTFKKLVGLILILLGSYVYQ